MIDIQVATTDKDLADSLSHAFHGLTGAAYQSNKGGELFIVGGWANEKVSKEGLRKVAEGVIREDDIAIIL